VSSRLEATRFTREIRLQVSRRSLAFLLAAGALGCGSRPATPAAAASSSQKDATRLAAPPDLGVLNQCFVLGDRFLLHARIDAHGANGRVYRQVWSFTCKGYDCRGAELSLNPFYEGKALGALDLNAIRQARAEVRSPFRYVIEWGVYSFQVDLAAGRVDVNGAGTPGRDVGSAPCSQHGVLWPPNSRRSAPPRATLDTETRRK